MRNHDMETTELRELIETIKEEEKQKLKLMKSNFETTREETKN